MCNNFMAKLLGVYIYIPHARILADATLQKKPSDKSTLSFASGASNHSWRQEVFSWNENHFIRDKRRDVGEGRKIAAPVPKNCKDLRVCFRTSNLLLSCGNLWIGADLTSAC